MKRIILAGALCLAATALMAAESPLPEIGAAAAPRPQSAPAAPAAPATTTTTTATAPVSVTQGGSILTPVPAATTFPTAQAEFIAELPNTLSGEGGISIVSSGQPADASISWALVKTGAAIAPGAPQAVELDGGPLRLRLSLSGMKIGATYGADIALTPKGSPAKTWSIRLRRGTGALPGDALSTPAAALQLDSGSGELVLPLRNLTASPVVVSPPSLVEITRQVGGQSSLSNLTPSAPRITCKAGPAEALTELAPGERCQARLTFSPTEPGLYSAKIAVTDTDGHSSEAVATLQVRRTLWAALALALVGALIGSALKFWTVVGRPQLAALEQLAAAWESWTLIHRSAEALALGAVSRPTGQRLGRLRGGAGAVDPAEVQALATRVERLDAWLQYEEQARRLKDGGASVLSAATPLRIALSVLGDTAAITAADTAIVQALEAYGKAIATALQAETRGLETAQAAPPVTVLDLRKASRPALKALLAVGDFAVALIGLVLILLSTFELVWLADPTWGDWRDMLGLFFGSIAAQAGGLSLVDGFRTRVRPAGA